MLANYALFLLLSIKLCSYYARGLSLKIISTTFTTIRIPLHMSNLILIWLRLICELLICILMGNNNTGSECTLFLIESDIVI